MLWSWERMGYTKDGVYMKGGIYTKEELLYYFKKFTTKDKNGAYVCTCCGGSGQCWHKGTGKDYTCSGIDESYAYTCPDCKGSGKVRNGLGLNPTQVEFLIKNRDK